MYAFTILHFGNNKIYFEYELYFLYMLRDHTINDIIYLYSINDTPKEYIKKIKSLNLDIKCIGFNDDKITYNVEFDSKYESFNLLRTCNYIYGFLLKGYEKICIVESDMIITENIDNIFNLNCPAIIYYKLKKINENILIKLREQDKKQFLQDCARESYTNGGVMLFKPDKGIYKRLKNNIKIVIKNNCIYPSETLFLITFNRFYNLPVMFNMSHFFVTKYNIKDKIKILHFNNTKFKPLYIINDSTFNINTMKNPIKKQIILYFKSYYEKYNNIIQKLLISL
jgi:hypothetical protein